MDHRVKFGLVAILLRILGAFDPVLPIVFTDSSSVTGIAHTVSIPPLTSPPVRRRQENSTLYAGFRGSSLLTAAMDLMTTAWVQSI
jgi:hypothetical protein